MLQEHKALRSNQNLSRACVLIQSTGFRSPDRDERTCLLSAPSVNGLLEHPDCDETLSCCIVGGRHSFFVLFVVAVGSRPEGEEGEAAIDVPGTICDKHG